MSESPKILDCSWGEIVIEGHGKFRDVKLFPGGAREWDWDETKTRHTPGIQFSDVEELIEKGATLIILTTGAFRKLQIMLSTIATIQRYGHVRVYMVDTYKGVDLYNRAIAKGEKVGALFHTKG
jgi:hypothetical protein